jgi:hypothetical protein
MIVPRSRLLFWVAAIVLPFALIGAVAPVTAVISLAFIAGLFLVALGDALGARKSLAGIGIELPAVMRMSKDRAAKLEFGSATDGSCENSCASRWRCRVKSKPGTRRLTRFCPRTVNGRG